MRLHHPWDSPGKNTGMGCHFLLQCMKVKSEREVAQSCLTLRNPMDCSLPGSSVHGIFQARVLEWGAITFSVIRGKYAKRKKIHLVRLCSLIYFFMCWFVKKTIFDNWITVNKTSICSLTSRSLFFCNERKQKANNPTVQIQVRILFMDYKIDLTSPRQLSWLFLWETS